MPAFFPYPREIYGRRAAVWGAAGGGRMAAEAGRGKHLLGGLGEILIRDELIQAKMGLTAGWWIITGRTSTLQLDRTAAYTTASTTRA